MKKTYMFLSSGLVAAALTMTPMHAQSTSAQSQGQPPSGTQSGQAGGRSTSGDQQKERGKEKVTSSGALGGVDRTFLADAMAGNRAEIALAELAQKKAASAAVRELASAISRDHQHANDKLTSIAGSAGAADNPTALKPEHQQLHDRLSKLDGAAFDSAYAAEMVKEHQKDIAKYEKASGQLQQSDLKSYATQTLPHLKQHLQKARAAQSQAGASTNR